jgi:hypothetical protein
VCAPGLRALPPPGAFQSSSPTRSLPSCLVDGTGVGVGVGGSQREGGKEERRGSPQEREAASTYRVARLPLRGAGAGPTARGGGSAQPGPPRAAAAAAEPAGGARAGGGSSSRGASSRGAGGAGTLGGWGGCGPEPPPPRHGPGVPIAPGRLRERTLRTPDPRRLPSTRRLITFALRPRGFGEPPARLPLLKLRTQRGEFLPVDVLFRNAKDQ